MGLRWDGVPVAPAKKSTPSTPVPEGTGAEVGYLEKVSAGTNRSMKDGGEGVGGLIGCGRELAQRSKQKIEPPILIFRLDPESCTVMQSQLLLLTALLGRGLPWPRPGAPPAGLAPFMNEFAHRPAAAACACE